MGLLYLLYEHSSGYGLFERVESDEIGVKLDEIQGSITDLSRFSKIMKLKSFCPFTSAQNALENINSVSDGVLTELLHNFLEMNLPKSGKKKKWKLGVCDPKLGNAISENMSMKVECNSLILELIRGIRVHFRRFIKGMKKADIQQSQLGLGHSYSRSKVKFNVHRVDNMIIQSIALLDQLEKDINTFSMRCREWYSWHFPELQKIVNDNYKFAQLAKLIKKKEDLSEASLKGIEDITGDPESAAQVLAAAKMSMGTALSEIDMINIEEFAGRVVALADYRKELHQYLISKMNSCAPNLTALIGERVGARLISHAGSLTNLAKYPASTVQILGAEKALFRALKTKGNTPKYGLIYHSTFIGQAAPKNKGRISRYLANKCSIASRIDCFDDSLTNKYGLKLKGQVEERLEFYKTGKAPRKNLDVMKEVITEVEEDDEVAEDKDDDTKKKTKKKKKRKAEDVPEETATKKAKKKKKTKKAKKSKK